MSRAQFLYSVSQQIFYAIQNIFLVGGLFLCWALLYIRLYIINMLNTTRTRKQVANRSNISGSKQSKDSNLSKRLQKIHPLSTTQIKLREAIQTKYQKSKIKNFRYTTFAQENQKNKIRDSSVSSQNLPQYANLKAQRFVNIQQYHSRNNKSNNKQYLIKFRSFEAGKKVGNTESDIQPNYRKIRLNTQQQVQKEDMNINLFGRSNIFGETFNERRTISGERKQAQWNKLGFQYHSASKNNQVHTKNFKRAPSQQEQNKLRLHYFRKQTKSPPPPLKYI